jgi:hypothetical protein
VFIKKQGYAQKQLVHHVEQVDLKHIGIGNINPYFFVFKNFTILFKIKSK